jgi:hypothetical protein
MEMALRMTRSLTAIAVLPGMRRVASAKAATGAWTVGSTDLALCCSAIVCTDPAVGGYTMTNTQLDKTLAFDVIGACAAGYSGIVTVTACTTSGPYSVSGCTVNSCNIGLALVHSPTTCSGVTGDECAYTCDAGYSVSGSHVCGTDASFAGGECVGNTCSTGLSVADSPTTCSGVTEDECAYTCDAGYSASGSHVCGTDA